MTAPPVTEREVGRFEQVVRQLEHRQRNDRMVVANLEYAIGELRADLDRLRVRVYTALAVVAAIGSALTWGLDLAARL